MEIKTLLVIGFVLLCLLVALALCVMAARKEVPPDSEVPPDQYLDDVGEATGKLWNSIK